MAVCDIQMKNKDKTLSVKIPVNQISNVLSTIKDMMQ